MKRRIATILFAVISLAALAVEPDVVISFNRGVQADVGGTGNIGSVLEGFTDPIGMKGAISPIGKYKEDALLVPSIEGKGVRIGKLEDGNIYKIIYKPLPSLSRLAGTVSVWVRLDDWKGSDGEYHTFFSAEGSGHRIFLYKTPNNDMAVFYGDLAKKTPSTVARFPVRNWKKGEWHHLCFAYDEKTLELHIDGISRALVPMNKLMPVDFNTIVLGQHWMGNPGVTTIDDLRIYNGVRLNESAMKAEYERLAKNGVSGAPLEFCAAPRTALVDGEVKANEYSISGNGFRSTRENYYSSLQSTWNLAYDEQNFYLGMISDKATATTQSGRDSTPYTDDSVELYMTDIYGTQHEYHFIFNSGNGFFDAKDNDINWNSEGVVFNSKTIGGKWHFEAAIPWSNFGVKPEDGKALRLNICRTFVGAGEFTQISPSGRSYSDKTRFAQLKLMKNAPQIDVTGFGQLNAAQLDCALHIRSDEDDVISWKMEAMDNYKPFIYSKDLKVAKGVELTEKCTRALPKDRFLDITVLSKKHGMLYHNSIDYHNAIALVHSFIYTDIPKDKLVFVYRNNSLGSGKNKLHATFLRKDKNVEYEETVDIPDDSSVTHGKIDVSKLTPGAVYDVKFQVTAPDGKKIIEGQEEYGYYKNGGPWTGTQYGIENVDATLPPWPPVKAKDSVFQCWGRECTFGGAGIISSFVSQKKELLTAPIALVANGSPVQFKAKLDSVCDARAIYTLKSTGALPMEVNVRAEFDGMMYFEVELGEGDYQSLQLKIPMDREHIDAFDDCSSIFEKLSFRDNPKQHYDINFVQKPFWWCGGDEVGLMGGTQSKRGWRIKDKAKSMSIDLDAKSVLLTMNMIDTPIKLSGKRKLAFYLDGTPVKPKRKGTERARERHNLVHVAVSGKYFGYVQPGYLDTFANWIKNRLRSDNRADLDKMQYFAYVPPKGSSVFSPGWHYYASLWTNPPPPLGSFSVNPGVFRLPFSWTWTCMNEPSHFDMQISCIQTILTPHELNFCNAGFYFDLSWPRACGNTLHGCAWTDEFGDVQQDNDLYKLREYYIRAYRMLKRARPDAYFYAHLYMTRTPVDSFFDLCVAGEMYDRYLAKHGAYYDVLYPELMRIAYASHVGEHSISLIPQFLRGLQGYNPENISSYNPMKPEWDKPLRHFLAYLQLHKMYPILDFWMQNEKLPPKGEGHVDKLYEALEIFGWEDVRFYGYFKKDKPVVCIPEHPRIMASVYTNGNKLFLVALNDTDQAQKMQVKLNAPQLASFRNLAGADVFNKKNYRLENGILTLELEGRDSAFILFK
ncbi:MAG: hypothetical protein J5746_05550 [Victivallales bacterium]|nr:hypothetical protein [Victivallales bacterium]